MCGVSQLAMPSLHFHLNALGTCTHWLTILLPLRKPHGLLPAIGQHATSLARSCQPTWADSSSYQAELSLTNGKGTAQEGWQIGLRKLIESGIRLEIG